MRLEYKFLVNNYDLERLRKKLLPFVELDQFVKESNGNEYTVRSIYFDSSNFDSYHEKIIATPSLYFNRLMWPCRLNPGRKRYHPGQAV